MFFVSLYHCVLPLLPARTAVHVTSMCQPSRQTTSESHSLLPLLSFYTPHVARTDKTPPLSPEAANQKQAGHFLISNSVRFKEALDAHRGKTDTDKERGIPS